MSWEEEAKAVLTDIAGEIDGMEAWREGRHFIAVATKTVNGVTVEISVTDGPHDHRAIMLCTDRKDLEFSSGSTLEDVRDALIRLTEGNP